jgi:RNA-directed DNA polymerase
MVNGPEDLPRTDLDAVDWDSIVWAGPAREVERLRQRIFKATREEDWPKVRNLQKLMVRHEALLLPDGGERPSIASPS